VSGRPACYGGWTCCGDGWLCRSQVLIGNGGCRQIGVRGCGRGPVVDPGQGCLWQFRAVAEEEVAGAAEGSKQENDDCCASAATRFLLLRVGGERNGDAWLVLTLDVEAGTRCLGSGCWRLRSVARCGRE